MKSELPVTFAAATSLHGVSFLKKALAVLFAIAAVLAGFVVAVVAALLTLVFFPLRRPVRVTMPGGGARRSGGVIDIEASEIPTESPRRLPNP
jgi:hypothetical protein